MFFYERTMKMTKFIAILMATVMASAALAGCTQKPAEKKPAEEQNVEQSDVVAPISVNTEELASIHKAIAEKTGVEEPGTAVVMNIDGYELTLAEFEYMYFSYFNNAIQYTMYYGFDILKDEEFLDSMEKMFDSEIKTAPIVLQMAEEKGIKLTEEEFNNTVLASYDDMKEQYGEEFESTLAAECTPSINSIIFYNYIITLYDKILSTYADTAAAEAAMADYVRAKHVLVQFPVNEDGSETTEEQKAEALAKAEEVYAKAVAGEDFDALIAEYNEDPGMSTYTDGYFFTYNEMVPEFEEAAFALEENGISEIVETSYGYHILKKLPVDEAFKETDAYKEKFDAVANSSAQEAFYNDMQAKADTLTRTNVENYNELIAPVIEEANALYAEYELEYNAAHAEAEEETVEGEEAEAEAEVETETEAEADPKAEAVAEAEVEAETEEAAE